MTIELNEFAADGARGLFTYVPSRSVKHRALAGRLYKQITTLVYHTTGTGPLKRQKTQLQGLNTAQCAAWIYQNIMDYSGHFVIGLGGEIISTVPVDLVAQHVGSSCLNDGVFVGKVSRCLTLTSNVVPKWWRLATAADQALTLNIFDLLKIDGTYNPYTIGIEFVTGPKAKDLLTNEQIQASLKLEQFLKQEIPTLAWATTHTILNPISRTAKGVRYDLYENQTKQLFNGREWKSL